MSSLYLNEEEILMCTQILQTDFPELAKEIIASANQARESLFQIPETMAADRMLNLGTPIDWVSNPTNDPEFTWLLNRHWHMPTLGKAYLLTEDQGYVDTFKAHFLSWVVQCPVPTDLSYEEAVFFQRLGPWRLLEVGLRLQSWLWTYSFIKNSSALDQHFKELFFHAVSEHADYLCHYLSDTEINHATMHMQGLFMAGIAYEEHPRSAYWRQVATERLELCLLHQIDEDGVQIELTPHYHNASIGYFGTPYVLAKKAGFPFSQWYENKLRSIAAFTEATIRPDGVTSPISDTNWSSNAPFELGFLGLALEDEYYLRVGCFSEELLWMFGPEQYRRYVNKLGENHTASNLPTSVPNPPQSCTMTFPNSGYYILRDASHYLFFDAAKMGGAHGHADTLSFEWVWNKQLLFSDLGRYTYEEGEMRKYFKSTKNHNTVTVDDQEQTPYLSSQKWGLPVAAPTLHRFIDEAAYFFIDASHDGYQRLEPPMVHRRWLLLLKEENLLLIVDWIKEEAVDSTTIDADAGGELQQLKHHHHQLRQHFNLSQDAVVHLQDRAAEITYPSTDMTMNMAWWISSNKKNFVLSKETGWISKEYGFKEEIPVINGTLSFEEQIGIATICHPVRSCCQPNIYLEAIEIANETGSVHLTYSNLQEQKVILITDDSIQLFPVHKID